jgi:hypothetical protein
VIVRPDSEKAEALRAGCEGDPARAAAVDLLIDAGLTRDDHPWIVQHPETAAWTIDFHRATDAVDAYTVEHQQWGLTPSLLSVLEVAASIADGLSVHLRHVLPELEPGHAALVTRAIAASAGEPESDYNGD